MIKNILIIAFISLISNYRMFCSDKSIIIEQIKKIKLQENEVIISLEKIERDIRLLKEKIELTRKIIIDLQDEIHKLSLSLEEHKKKMETYKNTYFIAIRNYYLRRKTNYLFYLLETKTTEEFLRRSKYLSYIFKCEEKIIDNLAKQLALIEKEKEELESKGEELNYHKQKLEFDKKELLKRKEKKKKILNTIRKKQLELQKKYEELKKGSKRITKVIQDIKKDKKEIDLNKNKKTKKDNKIKKKKSFYISWPIGDINSVITFFGKQTNEFNTSYFNTGIKIGCSPNSMIHAAGDGKVMYKGKVDGYGNVLILDHGNGYTTLYANLSSIFVGINERVKKGEEIARVYTDKETGMGILHFELRYHGEPIDPLRKIKEGE